MQFETTPHPFRRMDGRYWETVAQDYLGEVLSVWEEDMGGIVASAIRAAAALPGARRAADLGCGIGHFTRLMGEVFAEVVACDGSARAVAAARARCADCVGVRVWRLDLTTDAMPFAPVDCVLCCNVLLMPGLDERLRAWRTVTNQVAEGGELLLVVPSLEAVQLDRYERIEANLEAGAGSGEALAASLNGAESPEELLMGVQRLEGVPTKHYLREELEVLLPQHGLEVTSLVKLPYRSGGWDWFVTAERRG